MRDLYSGILEEFAERSWSARVYEIELRLAADDAEAQRAANAAYRHSERGRLMRAGQRARARQPQGALTLPGVVDYPAPVGGRTGQRRPAAAQRTTGAQASLW